MYLNEISYVKNQTLQFNDAKKFLAENVSKLEWEQEEGVVMDLGCGPGNTTLQLILPLFPNMTKLVAVDLLPNMIDFAKQNHSHPKIEYEVANVEEWNTIKRRNGKISKLVSIHCIAWLENQRLGFQNIFEVLKQGGEAYFCWTLKTPFWDSLRSTSDDQKWSTYLKNVNHHIPESQYRVNNYFYYKEMLEEIGFTVILCEEVDVNRTFRSDLEWKEMFASLCVGLSSIPVERREDFKDHLFQQYLSINPRSKDGTLHYTSTSMKLVIKKEKMK